MGDLSAGSKRNCVFWWTLWLVYAGAWTTALLTMFPIVVRDAVLPQEFRFPAAKTLHFVAYAVFAGLTSFMPVTVPRRRWLLLIVVLHAPTSEFLQQFVDRTPALADVGIDLAGITLGVLLTCKRWW